MKNAKHKFIPLWIMFLVYFFCYMTMEIELGVLLSIWTIGLSIYLLIKNKLPSKKGMVISVIFAALVSISYSGLGMGAGVVITNGILSGIPTLLCFLAVFSVMKENDDIKMITKDKKYSPLISIMLAIVVGAILSVVNYFLMKNSNPLDFGIHISYYLVCLNPAIYEEIACRTIFMAFCFYKMRGAKPTKFQQFTMWFMMCFPHTVAHNYGIIETVLLCVLFGLPLAFLQRKRDITSAMVCHGIIDAVRFTIFGLGL